jgi:hypothetical protein
MAERDFSAFSSQSVIVQESKGEKEKKNPQ